MENRKGGTTLSSHLDNGSDDSLQLVLTKLGGLVTTCSLLNLDGYGQSSHPDLPCILRWNLSRKIASLGCGFSFKNIVSPGPRFQTDRPVQLVTWLVCSRGL